MILMLVGHVLPPPLFFSCYFHFPSIVTWVESVNISKLDILSIYSFRKILPGYEKKEIWKKGEWNLRTQQKIIKKINMQATNK